LAEPPISQQQLEKALWDAANALRGPIDPADFKSYVFPILFFKWIDDTWHMHHRQAVEDFGDAITDEIEADYHPFTVPAGCHWSDVRDAKPGTLGATLQKVLQKLEQANPDKLANVFGDAQWANTDRLPERALRDLIDAFHRLGTLDPDHVPNDLLGGAYEYLLHQFADESGKKAGEFFTPRAVVRLLVKLLDPKVGETVYDPACGSGGMLVETIGQVREDGQDPRRLRLYGQEVSLTTSAIARMNLFIHDIEDFQIVRGDTLRDPKLRTPDGKIRTFDVVIANPPFSLKNWGADEWAADPRAKGGVPPAGNADFAWVQHMVASMNHDGGRVGIVMPHGVLFRAGSEAAIRRHLIETDQLEAVVGLPKNLFYSTSIPACILLFRTTKPSDRKGHVLFIDGSHRFTAGRNQNTMDEADLDAITTAHTTGEDPDGDGGVSLRLVPHEEIQANGWDLNISRYITGATEEGVDVATALAQLHDAQQALREAEVAMWQRLKEAGYGLA
jgi:type I restriction enzyme M protein